MLLEQKLYDSICTWIDAHKEEFIADLQSFAQIKSVSRADLAQPNAPFGPDCRKMLDFALETCRSYGFSTEDGAGFYGDAWIGERKTAVGIIGHLDVVPEGEGWDYPPYGATRVGDFLIGRGVGDNKSACVIGLYVLRLLQEIEAPLTNGARVIFGCSEETGMQDMAQLVADRQAPPVSLVPDAAYPVNYAQKGMMRGEMSIPTGDVIKEFSGGEVRNMVAPFASACLAVEPDTARKALCDCVTVEATDGGCIVSAEGKAAHAANPVNGESALLKLSQALAASGLLDATSQKAMEGIATMCADIDASQSGFACEDPETGKTTMCCGVSATHAGRISLSLDCRLSIATDLTACESAFRAFAAAKGFTVDELTVEKPFYIPKDDPRISLLRRVCKEIADLDAEPYTMGGGTYSRAVPNAITFGNSFPGRGERMDFGPGKGGAHQPNEQVFLPNLFESLKLIACAVILLDRLV